MGTFAGRRATSEGASPATTAFVGAVAAAVVLAAGATPFAGSATTAFVDGEASTIASVAGAATLAASGGDGAGTIGAASSPTVVSSAVLDWGRAGAALRVGAPSLAAAKMASRPALPAVVCSDLPSSPTTLFSLSFINAICFLFNAAALALASRFSSSVRRRSAAPRSRASAGRSFCDCCATVFVAARAAPAALVPRMDGTLYTGSTPAWGSGLARSASSWARRCAASRLALAETREERTAAKAPRAAAGAAAVSARGPAAARRPSRLGLGGDADFGWVGLGGDALGTFAEDGRGRGAFGRGPLFRFVSPLTTFSVSNASMLSLGLGSFATAGTRLALSEAQRWTHGLLPWLPRAANPRAAPVTKGPRTILLLVACP